MDDVYLYLDIDGVFNAVPGRLDDVAPEWGWGPKTIKARTGGFNVRFSPELIAAINELTALPHVHPFWLTTWLDEAVTLMPALTGLDCKEWPVLGKHEYDTVPNDEWWKFPAIRDHERPEGTRIVWVDDDLGVHPTVVKEWATTLPRDSYMIVAPGFRTGLTRAMFNEVMQWVMQ